MSSGALAQAFEEMPIIGRLMKKPDAKAPESVPLPPPQDTAAPEVKETPPEPPEFSEHEIMVKALNVIYTRQQDMAAYLELMMQEIMNLKEEALNIKQIGLAVQQQGMKRKP